jgi:hypothetical protein
MLGTDEIAALQAEVAKTFDQVLDVWRGSAPADDGYGGHGAGVPALLYSGVACEVYSGVAHVVDMPDFSDLVNTHEYTVSVAVGTDIQKDDIVVLQDGSRLRVNVVLEPESLELQMRFFADKETLNQ